MSLGTSDGGYHEDEWDFITSQFNRTQDKLQAAPSYDKQPSLDETFDSIINDLIKDTPTDANGMPLRPTEKPSGALFPETGTTLEGTFEELRQEPLTP